MSQGVFPVESARQSDMWVFATEPMAPWCSYALIVMNVLLAVSLGASTFGAWWFSSWLVLVPLGFVVTGNEKLTTLNHPTQWEKKTKWKWHISFEERNSIT
eukprot:3610954-Amphidinium_carterae.3